MKIKKMFDETKKYKTQGHFFFKKGNSLKEQSVDVPELPGVYYILRLTNGKVDLVYIGKSGTISQSGKFKEQLLKGTIRAKDFLPQQMAEENIDGLDIYWFVTMDKTNSDLPGYVEGILMQRYFDIHGKLPPWNKYF
jgi:hypothetical protein